MTYKLQYFKKMNSKKQNILYPIYALSCYGILLFLIRFYITQSIFYGFLIWNLFLAYIPLIISYRLLKNELKRHSKLKFYSLYILWLLFLPNAPYIITDLFHLQKGTSMPPWYDLLLVSSFALVGCLLLFISVNQIHQLLSKKLTTTLIWLHTISVFFLCGFGIYLGRYLRWNSWDIIQNPISLFRDTFNRITHPIDHPKTWGVTIGFGIFLLIGFYTYTSLTTSSNQLIDANDNI